MSFIQSLHLTNFRCYESAKILGIASNLVVLCGPNGAGKTNILESVSLLTPGRGLRNASHDEIQRIFSPLAFGLPPASGGNRRGEDGWSISSQIDTRGASVQIGTGFDRLANKRNVKINGVAAKSQMALSDYLSCVWLTPQMDRLFLDSSGGRRRFFDKLLFTFDSSHAGRVTRYENAMASRSKLLREGHHDDVWLKSLESQMAETGISIAAARNEFAVRLQKSCNLAGREEEGWFPKARLYIQGTLEELLHKMPAVEAEELFAYQLKESRQKDSENGGAATGAHKSDFKVSYAAKNMEAPQCSTGEQKALLIGIILAHARLMHLERGAPPILLLDEIAAHLDEHRRAALFDLLIELGGQVWMTGTDISAFFAILNRAQFWGVEQAKITAK